MDELISIGEFSRQSGLSPKRLRSYAAAGLLVPAAVDAASGYRYYSPGQLRDASLIDALREAGVPLSEIASFLRRPTAQQLDSWEGRVAEDSGRRRAALGVARHLLTMDSETARPENQQLERDEEPMTTMTMAARSECGSVRANNEDVTLTSDHLAIVADGMGGHAAGEVAAHTAVAVIAAAFTGRSLDQLEAGVRGANAAIWDRAKDSTDLQGMGTTVCTVGLTEGDQLAVVNVGDSRAYLLRDGSMSQLTQDHSVTAEMIRRGALAEQDALTHPHRNVLTRVLGGGPNVEPDCVLLATLPGDRVLLCTDGLFNEMSPDAISSVLTRTADASAAVDALVDAALTNGGRDNVSVVVVDITAQR